MPASQTTEHGSPARRRTGRPVTNHVPWSEYSELWRRRALAFDSVACIAFGFGTIVAAIFRSLPAVAICGVSAILWIWMVIHDARKLNAMLENKPRRGAAGLTTWIRLRPWQTEICCACGTIVHIDGAPWFPNPVDPGGGRFSIVCPCGIGYFKLEA
jgi:hypothetical protein